MLLSFLSSDKFVCIFLDLPPMQYYANFLVIVPLSSCWTCIYFFHVYASPKFNYMYKTCFNANLFIPQNIFIIIRYVISQYLAVRINTDNYICIPSLLEFVLVFIWVSPRPKPTTSSPFHWTTFVTCSDRALTPSTLIIKWKKKMLGKGL